MSILRLAVSQRQHLVAASLAVFACFDSAAEDDWTNGKQLFTTHCAGCHYNIVPDGSVAALQIKTPKSPRSAFAIKTAITNTPEMSSRNDLVGLDNIQLGKIEAFLSTGKHATLIPATAAFPLLGTAIGAPLSERQLTLKLKNDGEQVVAVTGTNSVFGAFGVNSASCGSLSIGGECSVLVTFNPIANVNYSANFSIAHDGYSLSTLGSASGKGLLNLEITSPAQVPFTADLNALSSSQAVSIANRLSNSVELCLVGDQGMHGDYQLAVGATTLLPFVDTVASSRCATLNTPVASDAFSATLTFKPSREGPRTAMLRVRRLGGIDTPTHAEATLIGNGGPYLTYSRVSGPDLVASPPARGRLFSTTKQEVFAGGVTTVLEITNSGNEDANITAISTAGDFRTDYVVTGCAVGLLTKGDSCQLSVTFDPNPDLPQNRRVRQAKLSLTYGTRPADEIELAGEAFVGPTMELKDSLGNVLDDGNGAAFDFGGQNINVGLTRQLVIKNLGSDGALDVNALLSLPRSGNDGFSLSAPATGGCANLVSGARQTLAAGATCLLNVSFVPSKLENYANQLTLRSQPSDRSTAEVTTRLNLSGVGRDDKPVLSWLDSNGATASVVAFSGKTAVGEAIPLRITLRLDNAPGNGAAALRVLNIVGRDAASFVLDQSAAGACKAGTGAPAVLEGVGCTVVIVFQPQAAGSKTASLQIDSTGTTPQPILITGEASGPLPGALLSTAPVAVNFGSTRVGASSAAEVVTLTNSGASSAQVNGIEIDAPFSIVGKTCPDAPFVLAARASCTISMGFAPGANGMTEGSLSVLLDGATTPHVTILTGEGIPAADLSSGGCSLAAGDTAKDPTLWTLLLLAMGALLYRGRRRAVEHHLRLRRESQ